MENHQIREQIKATLIEAGNTPIQYIDVLTNGQTGQAGNSFQANQRYLTANEKRRKTLRGKPRKTLRTGPVIPWSVGSAHL